MHSFEVHSNEIVCRKSGRLGLEQALRVLHKLQTKYFQIAFDKLSVMKFPLVEMETYFFMRLVLCTEIEVLSIQTKKMG